MLSTIYLRLLPIAIAIAILILSSVDKMDSNNQQQQPFTSSQLIQSATTPEDSDLSMGEIGWIPQLDSNRFVIPPSWNSEYDDNLSQNRESHGQFAISTNNRMVDEDKTAVYTTRRSNNRGYTIDIWLWDNIVSFPSKRFFLLKQLHNDFNTMFLTRAATIARYFWYASGGRLLGLVDDIFWVIALHYVDSFMGNPAIPADQEFDNFPKEIANLAEFEWEKKELMFKAFMYLPDITPLPALLQAKKQSKSPSLITRNVAQSFSLECARSLYSLVVRASHQLQDSIPGYFDLQSLSKNVAAFTGFDPIKSLYPHIASFLRVQPVLSLFDQSMRNILSCNYNQQSLSALIYSLFSFRVRTAEMAFNPPRFHWTQLDSNKRFYNNIKNPSFIPFIDVASDWPINYDTNFAYLSHYVLDYELRMDEKLSSVFKNAVKRLIKPFKLFPKPHKFDPIIYDKNDALYQPDNRRTTIADEVNHFNQLYAPSANPIISTNDYQSYVMITSTRLSVQDTSELLPYGIDFTDLDGHAFNQTQQNDQGQYVYLGKPITGQWNNQFFHNGYPLSPKQLKAYDYEARLILHQADIRQKQKKFVKRLIRKVPRQTMQSDSSFPLSQLEFIEKSWQTSPLADDAKMEYAPIDDDAQLEDAYIVVVTYSEVMYSNYLKPQVGIEMDDSTSSDDNESYYRAEFKPLSQQSSNQEEIDNNEDDLNDQEMSDHQGTEEEEEEEDPQYEGDSRMTDVNEVA